MCNMAVFVGALPDPLLCTLPPAALGCSRTLTPKAFEFLSISSLEVIFTNMFAAVYYTDDKKIEIVNSKKVNRLENTNKDAQLSTCEKVTVTYKTQLLDDAGREIVRDVDYDGIVVCVNKDKNEIKKLLDEEMSNIITSIGEGKLMDFMNECLTRLKDCGKRKSKKTKRMESYIDEEGSKSPAKKSVPEKQKATPKKQTRKSTQSADVDSPSKCTRSKTPSDPIAETQRLQTLQYFKQKKAKTLTSTAQKQTQENVQQTDQHVQVQKTSGPLDHQPKSYEPVQLSPQTESTQIPSLPQQTTSIPPSQTQPLTLPQQQQIQQTPHMTRTQPQILPPQQTLQLQPPVPTLTQPQIQLQQPQTPQPMPPSNQFYQELEGDDYQYLDLDGTNNQGVHRLSAAVSEAHSALYDQDMTYSSTSSQSCHNCAQMQSRIATLEVELESLKGKQWSGDALQDMQKVINYYSGFESAPTNSNSMRQKSSMLVGDNFQEISSRSEKMASTTGDIVDSILTGDFERFFEPGDNKIHLVEGSNLYIDSTKLQAMKSRSKKNPSRLVRELVGYYFTPQYMANHSATGIKSNRKGLPLEIVQPIREFMNKAFPWFTDTNVVINRKCLDCKVLMKKSK